MKQMRTICEKYGLTLCYIFGSQQEKGEAILKGRRVEPGDAESDIDFAVLFETIPGETIEVYASLSLELQELVFPFKADLLFLHEVDHLIQLEAVKGINVYANNEESKEAYEEKVRMLASDELEIFKLNERDFFEAIDHGYFEFEYKAD